MSKQLPVTDQFAITQMRVLVFAIWLSVAILAAYLFRDVSSGYADVQTKSEKDAATYARLIEEHATATIERADLALRSIADRLDPVDLEQGRSRQVPRLKVLTNILLAQQAATRGIVSISITDANGIVFANSVGAAAGISLASRRYFQELQSTPRLTPVISEAILGRVSGKWGIQVARRVDLPNGQFGGMIVANLGLTENFDSVYDSLGIDGSYVISLRDSENRLMARRPRADELLGKAVPSGVLGEKILANESEGVINLVSVIDGVHRIAAFRKSPLFPIYAVIAPSAEDAFRDWKRGRNRIVVFLVLLAFSALYVTKLLYRKAEDASKLLRQSRMLAEAEKVANLGYFAFDIQKDFWTSSAVLDRIFGIDQRYSRTSEGWLNLAAPQAREDMTAYWTDLVATKKSFDHVYPIQRVENGELRWVHGFGKFTFSPEGKPIQLAGSIADITARRQMEEQVREIAELNQTIIDTSMVGIITLLAKTGQCVMANEAAARIVGLTVDQLTKANVFELGSWRQAGLFELVQQTLTTGDIQHGQFLFEEAAVGKDRWTAVNAARFLRRGELHVLLMFEDITARRQAENDRLEQHELLQSILTTALDGYWLMDARGQVLDVNDAACAMLGYTKTEALGLNVYDVDEVHSNKVLESRVRRLHREGGDQFETRHRRKDGSTIDVEVSIRYLSQKSAFSIFVRDITQRKLNEGKLQLAASVFRHAREGIAITDAQGTIVDINETFTRITGYSRAEAIGQNPRILSSGRQDKAFYESMWNALRVQGHWGGEVWNRRKSGEVYAELLTISAVRDVQGHTQQYVALFSDITGIKEHQSELEHIAHFDALTGLPNRLLLADRLQQAMAQALRRGLQVAVAYLDLDGFKSVNDHHGHDWGDRLLIHLATAMKDTVREGDTLARLGGDEFVAVLIDLEDIDSCVPMLTRLLEAAAAPVQFGDIVLQGSASIGVTFYPQDNGVEADQLLRQADQAMYQAKLAGKNRYHIFDAAHDSNLRAHHETLERIRLALAQREFVLHYQPKVNMRSGKVIGAEALIRWQHPEKGLLAPAAFLPVIEDHPLAIQVGEWVIDTALTQIEVWRSVGLEMPVSVNIGARQVQQPDFMARLQSILARHVGVSASSLELEVLETSALADIELVSLVIEQCHQMGVKFALDDFGTGYSSLTYLKRLRVALLKIDQSFVRDMLVDPDDLAILEGIIGLAIAFKRDVIAEGVESVEHGSALLQLGCELAQGYGIARPMPAEHLPLWVSSWQPDESWSDLPWLGGNTQSMDD